MGVVCDFMKRSCSPRFCLWKSEGRWASCFCFRFFVFPFIWWEKGEGTFRPQVTHSCSLHSRDNKSCGKVKSGPVFSVSDFEGRGGGGTPTNPSDHLPRTTFLPVSSDFWVRSQSKRKWENKTATTSSEAKTCGKVTLETNCEMVWRRKWAKNNTKERVGKVLLFATSPTFSPRQLPTPHQFEKVTRKSLSLNSISIFFSHFEKNEWFCRECFFSFWFFPFPFFSLLIFKSTPPPFPCSLWHSSFTYTTKPRWFTAHGGWGYER